MESDRLSGLVESCTSFGSRSLQIKTSRAEPNRGGLQPICVSRLVQLAFIEREVLMA